jgi:hypothetical protein
MKNPLVEQAGFFMYGLSRRSYGKTGPTSASLAGIGIAKCKASVIESVMPIDLHTQQIDLVGFFHYTRDALDIEQLIAFRRRIKAQHIGHTGTSSALYTNSQALGLIKIRGLHKLCDRLDGSGGKGHR